MKHLINSLLLALLLAANSVPVQAAVLVRNSQPGAVIATPPQPDEFQPRAVILYAPKEGKDAVLRNLRDLKPTFP